MNSMQNDNERGEREARFPVTLDAGRAMPAVPRQRKLRLNLKSLESCRVEMAKLYRGMKLGEIESTEGTKRAYVLSLVGKLIEAGELTKRIEALEQRMTGR